MQKLNVVVLSEDIDSRIQIKNNLRSDDFVIAGYGEFNSAGMLKTQNLFPDVVICAVHGAVGENVLDFVQRLLTVLHDCMVVLLNDNITVDLVNTAAQHGIRTVLDFTLSPEDFRGKIIAAFELEQQRMRETNEGQKVRSKVLAFFGGKGGTGKSTLSVNIAALLAKMEKRVILIDLDLQFGDVALAMDLDPKDSIVELIQDRAGITIENINAFTVLHSSGVSVLSAPASPEYAEYVKSEHVEKVIDVLRPYYEYIVLDLPPTFNDVSIAALENSDEIMLIYNPDILSLRNFRTCTGILEQLHQNDKCKLIINKNEKGLIKASDFEKISIMEIFSIVSADAKLSVASLNKGVPIVVAQPRSEVGKQLQELADKILEVHSGIVPLQGKEREKQAKKNEKLKKKQEKLDKMKASGKKIKEERKDKAIKEPKKTVEK